MVEAARTAESVSCDVVRLVYEFSGFVVKLNYRQNELTMV